MKETEKQIHLEITRDNRADFVNHTDFCVGTGRMGLALHREYQDQLAMVQAHCHFRHIRGHGLFCDDMGICQVEKGADGTEHVTYNFTYLDRVMDDYRAQGLKPFLELGFMPESWRAARRPSSTGRGTRRPRRSTPNGRR